MALDDMLHQPFDAAKLARVLAYVEGGRDDPSWGGAAVTFPRIQGADICGEIVAVGDGMVAYSANPPSRSEP